MFLYFFLIFFLYYVIVGFFTLGWQRIPSKPSQSIAQTPDSISVVVPVRNEAHNIAELIEGLDQQSLPKDRFEVIIVDDDSEDETVEIVKHFMDSTSIDIRLLHHDVDEKSNTAPKKTAITHGIIEARGEIIVTTDGDCRVERGWLNSILDVFENKEVMLVSGAVVLDDQDDLFAKIQAMEFASLIGSGAAMIEFNYPLMCNGANLAFRKSAFKDVNGYEGNLETSTGDDVFLMQKIHKAFPGTIKFLKDPQALVYTDATQSLSALISQRKRWASKWNRHQLPMSWLLPVFLFIHYVTFLGALAAMVIYPGMLLHLSALILTKLVVDFIFLKKVLNFCKLRLNIFTFLICEILYPFYAILFGVIVHFGKFTWKARTFKQ